MIEQYLPVVVTFCLAGALVGIMVSAGRLLGPSRPSVTKGEPFECGNPPSGSAWGRFAVKFYMTAILFIVFDVETIFLLPWAVSARTLGWPGFAAAMVFIAILTIGLVYEWKKGALEWD